MEPKHYAAESRRKSAALAAMVARHYGLGPVLDVGAWDGGLGRALPRGVEYLGLDANPRDVGVAKFDLNSGPLPLPDLSQGTVVAADVFEHVRDPDALLGEVARVMAPGGLAVFSFPNEAGVKGRLDRLGLTAAWGHDFTARSWAEQRDGWHHLWYFTPAIAREFVSSRLRVVGESPYWGRVLSRAAPLRALPSTCTCLMVAARRAPA